MGEMFGTISNFVYQRSGMKVEYFVIITRFLKNSYFFQLLLLQESWKDLFLLHLSQWAVPWDLSNLLNTRQTNLRNNGHILSIEEEVVDMEIKTMQVKLPKKKEKKISDHNNINRFLAHPGNHVQIQTTFPRCN